MSVHQTHEVAIHRAVHLLDREGKVSVGRDSVPGEGTLPTPGWVVGEYLTDSRRVELPAGLSAGRYQVEIGLYDPSSGARLPVTGENGNAVGDRILLKEGIEVVAN